MPSILEILRRCLSSSTWWPPRRLVMFAKIREPIALHCPVTEFAPVPGRPMLPVISARLIIACAARVVLLSWFPAHTPPEKHASPPGDCPREPPKPLDGNASLGAHRIGREPC